MAARVFTALLLLCASSLTHAIMTSKIGYAVLSGAEEVPATVTNATATATVVLYPTAKVIRYAITIANLSGDVTGAHFHLGVAGANGPVAIGFTEALGAGKRRAFGTIRGLTAAQVAAFLANGIYMNIHTAKFASGEIRGQVIFGATNPGINQLLGSKQVPPVVSPGAGTFAVKFVENGRSLWYSITVARLKGRVTAIHFHGPGKAGVNAGVLFPVPVGTSATEGTFTGIWWGLTQQHIDLLDAGLVYINVHTTAFPDGEVRAQVAGLTPPARLRTGAAQLSGAAEVPPTATNATGSLTLGVNVAAKSFTYGVTVAALTGPVTGAHFHLGGVGINGPIAVDITAAFAGGKTHAEGSVVLTDAHLAALLANGIYINIHTAAFPGGEIRGQVGFLPRGNAGASQLSGKAEVPPLATPTQAAGTLATVFVDNGRALNFFLTVAGLNGTITGVHFHGPASESRAAPVIFALPPAPSAKQATLAGLWPALTQQQVDWIAAGLVYFNVHTTAFPGGEVRGQVLQTERPVPLRVGGAVLSGDAEVPPSGAAGKATGSAELDVAGRTLWYGVTADSLTAPITAAHFHLGAVGVNGDVTIDFSAKVVGNHAEGVAVNLTDDQIAALLANNTYINLHDAEHPKGRLRGQVLFPVPENPAAAAQLSSANEIPVLLAGSAGTGTVVAHFLNATALWYSLTVASFNGNITAAHFHGPAPSLGAAGVLFAIPGLPAAKEGTVTGVWNGITPELATLLRSGLVYVNVHSTAFPGGEVRAQLYFGWF